MQQIVIYPRDPLVARDSRPFGRGVCNRMYSLPWPYPSVVAGSFRTMIGKEVAGKRDAFSDQEFLEQLKKIRVRGPLFCNGNKGFYFQRPSNFLRGYKENQEQIERLIPKELHEDCGINLPVIWPVMPSIRRHSDQGHSLWPQDMLVKWLMGVEPAACFYKDRTIEYPPIEERVHIKIDPERKVTDEGDLFSTQGLDFNFGSEQGIAVRTTLPEGEQWQIPLGKEEIIHPLGGVRRLAVWKPMDKDDSWIMPEELTNRLVNAQRICMYVATPAIFAEGWLPRWLSNDQYTGCIPGTSLLVKLRGATIGRWQAVSGWSYELRGPKPIRRLVPAGSVYFFEVVKGDAAVLSELWLQSLSDDVSDAYDGFGLTCWGVW